MSTVDYPSRNLQCVNGVVKYRSEGRTIFSRICPACLGKGCKEALRV